MSVEALSDSELRRKLAEYGYPVGPVTQTTRKILVKKLKNLIETRGGTGSRHSLAARYSSDDTDEDSMSDSLRKKKTANLRRQTMANPMPPPPLAPSASATTAIPRSPTKRRIPSRNSESKGPLISEYDRTSSELPNRSILKSVQKKFTNTYKSTSTTDGLETGSDSDVMEESEKYPIPKFGMDTGKLYDSRIREHSSSELDRASKPYDSRSRTIRTTVDEKYSVPPFKSNISPIQSVKDGVYGRDDSNKSDPLDGYERPYLSEFTKRLSLLSATNILPSNLPTTSRSNVTSSMSRSMLPTGSPEVKEADSNGHFSSLQSSYPMSSLSSRYTTPSIERPRDIITRTFKSPTDNKEAKNNQNLISMVLVVVLALFFGILAIVYLGLGGKTENIASISTESNIPLCSLEADRNKPGVNCILKENVDNVLQLLNRLHPILQQRAISAVCDNTNDGAYLTSADVIKKFTNEKVSEFQVKEDLYNAQVLIFENPKWEISLLEINEGNKEVIQILDSMDKIFSARLDNKIGMAILNPELPIQCLIKNRMYTVFSSLLIVAIGVLGVISLQKLFLWYLKYKKRSEKEVFQLVSEIISMVELHHQNCTLTNSPGNTQESYLAINHVRDNLIPPKDRKRMANLWEKAVKFLDENESRIRREVQQVAGEEFHVWRWLPSNNLNTSNSQVITTNKKSKVWQGQAFETMEGSVNSLTCSPTPCLKIRHMFDPDVEFEEDWETKVQDAILEKCGEGVKILHIRVDRGSREGCVYVKCMSQEDAGKAYRALHGWWFDSNLVTVKYLRLERYHERFPDSIRYAIPLKPSNNQRLSMQAHYWQSPLETN